MGRYLVKLIGGAQAPCLFWHLLNTALGMAETIANPEPSRLNFFRLFADLCAVAWNSAPGRQSTAFERGSGRISGCSRDEAFRLMVFMVCTLFASGPGTGGPVLVYWLAAWASLSG